MPASGETLPLARGAAPPTSGIDEIVPSKVDRILGTYWDNGEENGNYYLGFRVWSPWSR